MQARVTKDQKIYRQIRTPKNKRESIFNHIKKVARHFNGFQNGHVQLKGFKTFLKNIYSSKHICTIESKSLSSQILVNA